MTHPFETFGYYLFSRQVMRERLPRPVYKEYRRAMQREGEIDQPTADAIAHAMKVWALERGATHFCHWFQPLNGRTAEKHDAFIEPDADGEPITRLSGKALMAGETDGSSFPNGGLRDTFEARGYTFWDPNSYAFVRGHVLYIPSVFMSYRGDTLDLKMPLIKAIDALSTQAVRVLHDLGKHEVKSVEPILGLEQEFFLVEADQAQKRPDLRLLGRTLFSAELLQVGLFEDTYFEGMNERVTEYMDEVNKTLWDLGIYARIEHNEVSPGQYEFSSIFDNAITTIDQNMVVMDVLETVAPRHNFRCLLHEKPFSGMNGSGKHNNLSLITSTGENLFDPGEQQPEDLQFLLFMTAFIVAVDRHQTLLRMAASDEGNDHRLGGNEAPPAVMSINLGTALDELFGVLAKTTDIPTVKLKSMIHPIKSLADLSIETTDRNRTSPVSFTGNKFEIRILGSSLNASAMNTFLYAGMAEVLEEIAERLEAGDRSTEEALHSTTMEICHELIAEHQKILFSGDGYKNEWQEEAKRRGLEQVASYIDSVEAIIRPETIALCEKFDILNREELAARHEVLVQRFSHSLEMQARVLLDMASRGVIPALTRRQIELNHANAGGESKTIERRWAQNGRWIDAIDEKIETLRQTLQAVLAEEDTWKRALRLKDEVRHAMADLTSLLNEVDAQLPEGTLPYPSQESLVVQ